MLGCSCGAAACGNFLRLLSSSAALAHTHTTVSASHASTRGLSLSHYLSHTHIPMPPPCVCGRTRAAPPPNRLELSWWRSQGAWPIHWSWSRHAGGRGGRLRRTASGAEGMHSGSAGGTHAHSSACPHGMALVCSVSAARAAYRERDSHGVRPPRSSVGHMSPRAHGFTVAARCQCMRDACQHCPLLAHYVSYEHD